MDGYRFAPLILRAGAATPGAEIPLRLHRRRLMQDLKRIAGAFRSFVSSRPFERVQDQVITEVTGFPGSEISVTYAKRTLRRLKSVSSGTMLAPPKRPRAKSATGVGWPSLPFRDWTRSY
jgi:hypothetical protein